MLEHLPVYRLVSRMGRRAAVQAADLRYPGALVREATRAEAVILIGLYVEEFSPVTWHWDGIRFAENINSERTTKGKKIIKSVS